MILSRLLLTFSAGILGISVALAQPSTPAQTEPEFRFPDQIQNRQTLPSDIGGDRLRRIMVGFSRSLGVRCTHCHVGEEGAPLSAIDFVSDANPNKQIAREMLRMAARINRDIMPEIPGLVEPVSVTCFTCHRGATQPAVSAPPPAQ